MTDVDGGWQRGTDPSRRPHVRWAAIGEAWELYKQQWGTWMLASAVAIVGYGLLNSVVFSAVGMPRVHGAGGFRVPPLSWGTTMPFVLMMMVIGPFLGGFFRMACRQIRGQPFGLETFVSVVDVIPSLILGSALYGLAIAAGSACLVVPGLVASAVLMFTIPLIVDARLEPLEAIRQSWQALRGEWLEATIFHLVLFAIAGSGACCCVAGLLLSAPLYSLTLAVLYRDFFLANRPSAEKPNQPQDPYF